MGLFDRGVKKTKEGFFQRLSRSIIGKSKVDDSVLDAIEEALVASDMGVDTTLKIVDSLEERVEKLQKDNGQTPTAGDSEDKSDSTPL